MRVLNAATEGAMATSGGSLFHAAIVRGKKMSGGIWCGRRAQSTGLGGYCELGLLAGRVLVVKPLLMLSWLLWYL